MEDLTLKEGLDMICLETRIIKECVFVCCLPLLLLFVVFEMFNCEFINEVSYFCIK